MPKRRTDDVDPESRTDYGVEIKSRSGRLVKPKVYKDGTIALMEEKSLHLDQTDADDLPSRPTTYAAFDDEDDELSDVSEGSYGSTRTRPARGAHSSRMDNSRPSRRTATRPSRGPNSTHAAGYGGGGVFKQAAVEILRSERRLMSTGEITKLALRRGLVRCTGKTPEATMASALYTDIKRKEDHSLFVRPREGLFGLREWVDEGVIQIQPPQHTTTHIPLPASHHHHYTPAPAGAGAMDSDNGTGTDAHHSLDGDYQQPGMSQDSGDRLMELLCAAEEINREVSPPISEEGEQEEEQEQDGSGEEKVLPMRIGEEMDVVKVEGQASEEDEEKEELEGEQALLKAAQPIAAGTAFVERHESTNIFSPAPKPASTTIATFKATEIQVQQLESLYGTTHPEVGLGYLNLAKLYMSISSGSTLPAEMKTVAEVALQKAEEAMTAYQQASNLRMSTSNNGITNNVACNNNTAPTYTPCAAADNTTTSVPGTAINSKHQGFLVPAAPPTAPGPVKLGKRKIMNPEQTPAGPGAYGSGPVAAPTPLALEEARGWNSGPFAVTTGPLPTSALPPASIVASGVMTAAGKHGGAPVATTAANGNDNGVASDTENDGDVEICLPAPAKGNGGQRLPLHAVTAPLTAT